MLNFTINWIENFENFHKKLGSIYIEGEYGEKLNTNIPIYKNLPELKEIDGLSIITDEQREEYFKEITDMRVSAINGVPLDWKNTSDCMYCDYCNTNINTEYYHCWYCWKDMCNLCYNETSEEIAKQNGAQNYAVRQECRNHDLQHLSFPDGDNYQEVWSNTRFGSMLDWIPIYTDGESVDKILINCNVDSEFCDRIAVCCADDHGRFGYYIFENSRTLESILSSASLNYEMFKLCEPNLDGWDRFYSMPIKKLMIDLKMRVHYG